MEADYGARAKAFLATALAFQIAGAIGLPLRNGLVVLLPLGAFIGIIGLFQLARIVDYPKSFKIAMAISLFVAPINFATLVGLLRRSMRNT